MIVRKFNELDRIVNHLMLNTHLVRDMSLWYGQMGVALAFYHYYRYTNNKIYSDVTSVLLDNISNSAKTHALFSFSSGLLGIGWGVEYLSQKGFIKTSSPEICEEINKYLMQFDINRISDLSLESGIEGYLHYVIFHLKGAIIKKTKLPFDKDYLSSVYILCSNLQRQSLNSNLVRLLSEFKRTYSCSLADNYVVTPSAFVEIPSKKIDKILSSYPLGLRDGLSGILLNNIEK